MTRVTDVWEEPRPRCGGRGSSQAGEYGTSQEVCRTIVWVATSRSIHTRSLSLSNATTKMRRFLSIPALILLASAANAQDTTVVIVRHLPAQQDTSVVVRHLAPPPTPAPSQRMAPPPGASRYALRSTAVIAKDPYVGTMLSFVFPGGGQYYAGANGKGLALTLIGIGAPIIGYANVHQDHGYSGRGGGSCDVYNGPSYPGGMSYGGGSCHGHTDWTPWAIGLGVGVTAWIYGIATAGTDVQHWNQAHGVRFLTAPGRAGFAVALP